MAIKIHNTLTRTKEAFEPLKPGKVSFYLCGPTVYDYFHIGNARPFIMFDVFRRFLRHQGFDVTYVVNITDIDDKIIERSNREKRSAQSVAEEFTQAYLDDLLSLRVEPADIRPKATEHISDMIALVEQLIDQDMAYAAGGDVFFRVDQFAQYGQLSGKNTEELQAGSRVEVNAAKKNPLDFVLWKSAKPGEPAWESPWGEGRPGWHLECSAMSVKYLGDTFDFHAGGEDLIFPHHENELAQSQGTGACEFARYWMHNGFLNIRGEKMSKSEGNVLVIREILKHHRPEVLRLFFLQKHYRSPIDYSDELLEQTGGALSRLQKVYDELKALKPGDDKKSSGAASESELVEIVRALEKDFEAAMADDFNTAMATGKMFELVKECNKRLSNHGESGERAGFAEAVRVLETMDDLFLLLNREGDSSGAGADDLAGALDLLVDIREALRQQKLWQLSDQIRDRLAELGYTIEDGAKKSTWKRSK